MVCLVGQINGFEGYFREFDLRSHPALRALTLPDRLGVYEATYQGPGRVSLATRLRRDLDPRGQLASPRLP